MQRIFFSFFITLSLMQFSSAQKIDVRGIVTDSASGERIPYATVTVIGTNRGAVTNNNGFYLVANLSFGTYQITATSLGYQTAAKTVNVHGKEFQTINFALITKPVEVEEVVVTGGGKIELQEINTSVHILDQKELQKVPSAAQEDLFRSIQIIPGVVSSADVSSKFYVRGGAGDQNLIYFDGMKIYNPFHAFGIFSIFDPDVVKTTEVFTGAFPAGYGGRLSSVINITSRNGSTTGLHGGVAANFISGKAHLEGPLPDNNSWIVSGRKSLFNDTFKKFLRNPVPISFYDIFAKASIGGSDYGRYSVQTFLSSDDIISPKATEADHRWRSQSFAWTISDLVENRVYIDAVVHGSSFSIVRDAKQSTVVHSAESKISDGGLRGEMTVYTESRDLFFIGFDMNIPRYKYSFINSSNVHVEYNDISPEMWTWLRYQYITEPWKLDLGFHSDIISLFNHGNVKTTFQPRMNISYAFDTEWRLKFSYGMFSQNLITLTNEDDIISLFEAWIFIPKNLKPETASHYVLGVSGNIYSELSVDVQTYFKDYTSLVVYNREKKFITEPDYINGTGSSYGIETLFRYKYSFLDLYVAYTLGWTSITIDNFKYSPRYDRRHTVNILDVSRLTENIELSVRWEIASGYPYSQTIGFYDRLTVPDLGRGSFITDEGKPYTILGEKNAARLPAYHRLDITLTYKYQLLLFTGNIGLSIVNVYNSKNILYYDRKTLQSITMLPFLPSVFAKLEF